MSLGEPCILPLSPLGTFEVQLLIHTVCPTCSGSGGKAKHIFLKLKQQET